MNPIQNPFNNLHPLVQKKIQCIQNPTSNAYSASSYGVVGALFSHWSSGRRRNGTVRRFIAHLLIILLFFLLAPNALLAAQITLAWAPKTPTPDSYRLFQRTAGQEYNYSQPVWTGSANTYTVTNLQEGTTYAFVVLSYIGSNEVGDSAEATYQVPVSNQAPMANAGADQTVQSHASVSLNGSASSDPDGSIQGYQWTQTAGTSVQLAGAATAHPTFTAPTVTSGSVTLTFRLTVTDNQGLTSSDTCQVRVDALPNQAPVANAGANQTVVSQSHVTLNGSGSRDPEGQPLTYHWVQTSGTGVSLSNANTVQPGFDAPSVSSHSVSLAFELTVTDSQGLSSSDTCIILVNPAQTADNDGDGIPDDVDLDDDNDGMPDIWETQYGLDPLHDDAAQDLDGDGISNLAEYQQGSDPTVPDGDHAPAQPQLTYPTDNAVNVDLRPLLQSSAFADPDQNDRQSQTQWRILTSDNQHTVLDITSKRHLTSFKVPRLVLDPSTSYRCQVRYFDQAGEASDWSPAVAFATKAGKPDKNKNGVPDVQELNASTDLNADGIPDIQQEGILKGVQIDDGQYQTAVSIEGSVTATWIESVDAVDAQTIEDSPYTVEQMPYGLLAYKILVEQPGQTATMTLLYSAPLETQTQWIHYDDANGWDDFTDRIQMNISGIGTAVVRQIQDGGPDDADGVANGIIVDLAGPLLNASQSDGSGSSGLDSTDSGQADTGGSSSSGCFISSLVSGNTLVK